MKIVRVARPRTSYGKNLLKNITNITRIPQARTRQCRRGSEEGEEQERRSQQPGGRRSPTLPSAHNTVGRSSEHNMSSSQSVHTPSDHHLIAAQPTQRIETLPRGPARGGGESATSTRAPVQSAACIWIHLWFFTSESGSRSAESLTSSLRIRSRACTRVGCEEGRVGGGGREGGEGVCGCGVRGGGVSTGRGRSPAAAKGWAGECVACGVRSLWVRGRWAAWGASGVPPRRCAPS